MPRKHGLKEVKKTEFFKYLGTMALISVLEGKLTAQKANSVLRMLRQMYDKKANYETIKKYLYRNGLLSKDQLLAY